MIYLDYSATTPLSYEVSDAMNKTSKEFIGNPNSLNELGRRSSNLLNKATKQIAMTLACSNDEITFTSSATEANNMALIGVAMQHYKRGKHIIVSKLEHPSIYKICDYLVSCGFSISYVKNTEDGLIDFDDLKSLISEDTILVSICAVNSELGIRQPLKIIRQIIKKQNPNTYFHSDVTQAIGKVTFNTIDVDLASMSSHKIYGPIGIGMLYKSKDITIKPLIYGSGKNNELKPGTPALPLIVGFSKAVRLSQNDLDQRNSYIEKLNEKILLQIKDMRGILVNQTRYSIPQVINISLLNVRPETFIRAMDEDEIYISTNTACSSGDISSSVMAVYNDKLRASRTIRISLSHLTTLDEVNTFLEKFKKNYILLNNL
ncbi:MAG: cysteine desulfurase family protein [bacterium]